MKRNEQLFYLIQSLTKSEKRYFKVYASRHTIGDQNSYLLLFDLIAKQKTYNEEDILKKIKDDKLRKNLSTVKVQLSNHILKSLRQYKSALYKRYELRELMDFAHILYDKGLHEYSARTIAKAKKIAKAYDAYIYLDEITSFEFMLAIKSDDHGKIEKYLDITRMEGRNYRKINNNLATYEELEGQVRFLALKYHRIRSTSTQVRYDAVVDHPLLQKSPVGEPVACQIMYHSIWAEYHYVKRNGDACIEHIEKAMMLCEMQDHIVADTPEEYLKHLSRYMRCVGSFGHYDKFDAAASKLEQFADSVSKEKLSINLSTEILNSIYNMKLSTELEKGSFSAALEVVKNFEEDERLSSVFNIPAQEMIIHYNAFYVYFGVADYSNALKHLNAILNENYHQIRVDCQCFSRVLNIILHYEMGHYDLIDSLVKSTSRFLISRERKFAFETVFLKFAKTHLQDPFTNEKRKQFEKFRDELRTLFLDPQEAIVLYYFDVLRWLEGKIEGKLFVEMSKSKL